MGNQPTNYTHTCTNMQNWCISWPALSGIYMLYKQHTHQMNTDCNYNDCWRKLMHTLQTSDLHCLCYTHTHIMYMLRYAVHNTEMCSNCTVLQRLNKSRFQFNSFCFGLSLGTLSLPFTYPATGLGKELHNGNHKRHWWTHRCTCHCHCHMFTYTSPSDTHMQ